MEAGESKRCDRIATVTTTELNQSVGKVLDRIARGERLIVTCHNRPLATLQPLDGIVVQPFTNRAHDIYGWPAGGELDEVNRLTEGSNAQGEAWVDQSRAGPSNDKAG